MVVGGGGVGGKGGVGGGVPLPSLCNSRSNVRISSISSFILVVSKSIRLPSSLVLSVKRCSTSAKFLVIVARIKDY